MDANNWRPTAPGGESAMDTGDWRSQLPPDSRPRIVNKIMETLKKHLPFSGQEGLQELRKIAIRFEEKIYTAASSQSDYLRKISLKMLTMETKSQNTMPNTLPSNSTGNGNKPLDSGAPHSMQSQVHNQGQSLPIPMSANQPQARQQLLSQNLQNNIPSNGVQSSAGLPSAMPPVSGLNQTIPNAVSGLTQTISNAVGQNPNMQSISGVSQNSMGNSMGQGVSSNMFANSQRQMPVRQQVPQQQQQQSQTQQYMYQQQQQLQQQLLKQKLQQGSLQHPLVSSHMQQQQQQQQPPPQQNLLQPNQLQSSQQSGIQASSVMQPSMTQTAALSSLQPNQPSSGQQSTQSMLQQHPQAMLRQQPQSQHIHQQQSSMMQQPLLPPQQQQQQQQQLMGQQSNATNMQQNQLIGQQSNVGDMQQQQQRLLSQHNNLQNNLQNLQQQKQQQQQQLMAQQNNLSNMHQQQLGPQNNVSGLQQQQQFLGAQSGNSSLQTNQHPVHMLQQPKIPLQQQAQQSASSLLPNHGQQSQPQLPQQQSMSQIQSQPQLQQQMGLQQQTNSLQRDLQQRLQASGALLQPQNVIDQQKQLYQSQRAIPETSSTSLDSTAQTGHANGGDWQEEVFQKIQVMKDMYYPELNEMYQKIATKLQQHDSLPQQPKSDQLEKLKMFKTMLERIITFLQVSKSNISLNFKEKLGSYEKQIINFLNTSRPRKPIPSLQQGQLPQSHMQSMQQPQSQIPLVQSHENQMNPQMQSMSMQGSVPTLQQNNMSSPQHNSLSSLSGLSTSQQTMMNPMQSGSNLDSGQGNALGSMPQTTGGSMQQNPMSNSQQANINTMSTQSGVNMLQQNLPLQSNSNMIQHQHLKQQHEQQMLPAQQLKHFQQRQMQQQQQQLHQQAKQQQQLHQQAKQQLPAQMQTHQISQLNTMNDVNEMKIRQGMGAKSGVFQQHLSTQRTAYPHQQMKSGPSFPISSPQLLQSASPQLQHLSPQVDQQNLLSSLTKTGTPLQSASSSFIVPSPSTPLAPSPMPGDSEKPLSGISSLSNAGNIGHQPTVAQVPAPSLAIGTPGISASPLLAESTPDGVHGGALTTVSGKLSVTEQPLERLIKAVKSLSPKALSASVSDISSVVSMIDRNAGSAPGNGSRAAVGEDLVAMTKCRLQARNFITQDGMTGSKKMRRYTSAMPLNVVSSAGSISDSLKQFTGPETSDLESTATSSVKRPRIEANHALMEEIREINQRLIDTVVDISDEDVDPTVAAAEGGEGTIVKCSFSAVALSPNLKSQYATAQMSPIQPLRLLVPTNYPNCSPILLDKFPVEVSKEYEDLSIKAKSRFSISLRSLSQPMSLGEIARTWDVCARAIISEHAQLSGGGSFSSKYGTWENCLSAA